MILSKTRYVAVALFVALLLAGSANAQRRVFTNEDIQSAPSPAPATPAAVPETTQPTPPSPAPQEQQATAPDEVSRLSAILNAINDAAGLLGDKVRAGQADENTLARWEEMRLALSGAYDEFRQFLAEAQAQADRAAAASAEGPPRQP